MRLVCTICGETFPLESGHLACPHGGSTPHPFRKELEPSDPQPSLEEMGRRWFAGSEANSTIDSCSLSVFRERLGSWNFARHAGLTTNWRASLSTLDSGAKRLTGRGVDRTPLVDLAAIAETIGINADRLFIKNETENLLGSHKSRHHMGAILYLEMIRQSEKVAAPRRPLAIFSCGNAAMGAAAVAGAIGYPLYTFVPFGINKNVESILSNLGATVMEIRRDGAVGSGDPCFNRYEESLQKYHLVPFSCYGRDSWPSIEGGEAMGLEFIAQIGLAQLGAKGSAQPLVPANIDALIVQVGGGGLAHSIADAIESALALGLLRKRPRIYLVQTESVYPLVRGYGSLCSYIADDLKKPVEKSWINACQQGKPHEQKNEAFDSFKRFRRELSSILNNESVFKKLFDKRSLLPAEQFGPWKDNLPQSIADGILDDTTYDGFDIALAMARSGGFPLTVSEEELAAAHRLVSNNLRIDVSPTGTAGIAAATVLRSIGEISETDTVALLLTGVGTRTAPGPVVKEKIHVVEPGEALKLGG